MNELRLSHVIGYNSMNIRDIFQSAQGSISFTIYFTKSYFQLFSLNFLYKYVLLLIIWQGSLDWFFLGRVFHMDRVYFLICF